MGLQANITNEQFYPDLVEKSLDLMQCVNGEGRILYVNYAWKATLGWTDNEIENLYVWDILHRESLAYGRKVLQKISCGEQVTEVDLVFKTKSGEKVYVEGRINSDFASELKDVRIWGIFRNVTHIRGHYREAVRYKNLLEEKTLLQELYSQTSASFVDVGREDFDEKVNLALERFGKHVSADRVYIFTYSFSRGVCDNTYEWCQDGIVPQIDELQGVPLEAVPDWVDAHVSGKTIYIPDVSQLPPDNGVRLILEPQGVKSLITLPMMKDEQCYGFIGFDSVRRHHAYSEYEQRILLDLASLFLSALQRKSMQLEIEDTKKLLESVLKSQKEMICRFTADSTLTFVNQSYCDVFKKTSDELIGTPFLNIIPPEDYENGKRHLKRLQKSRSPVRHEHQMEDSSGGIHWYEWTDYAIGESDGKVEYQSVGRDVTQIREAERALEKERLRLEAVIEGSHLGTWEWNVQTGEIAINEIWAEIVGYTLEELEPIDINTWADLTHPDDLEASNAQLHEVFTKQKHEYDAECRMQHKDGHWVWIRDHGNVIRWSSDGTPLLMYGTHTDISYQKKVEAQLLEQVGTYETLVSNSPGAIFRGLLDAKCTTLFISDAIEAITGYTAEDFQIDEKGYTWIVHPMDREVFVDSVEKAVSAQIPYTIDYRIVHKDGTFRWVRETGQGVFDNGGALRFIDGLIIDVTERRQIHEKLRMSERQLAKLAQQVPGCIYQYQLRPDGTTFFPFASDGVFSIFGITPTEVRGDASRIFSTVHPEDIDELLQKIIQSAQSLSIWEQEFRLSLPNGDERWIRGKAQPERLDNDDILWHGYISDITEEKKINLALEESNRLLESARMAADSASFAKTRFLANMSHEIRTPMNAVLGFTHLLMRDPSLLPQHKEYVENILRSGGHLLHIINEVLDRSKIEEGHMVPHYLTFNLRELLYDLQIMFTIRSQESGVSFSLDIAEGLPEFIQSDESKIRQILINLLGNAYKFTTEGQVVLRVLYKTELSRSVRLIFEVEDTGPGITADDIEVIFTPFYQEDNAKRLTGTGLGLSISRSLAEMMGGSLNVYSKKERGSCFRFELYTEQGSENLKALSVAGMPQEQLHRSESLEMPLVLVVDTDSIQRKLLSKLLQSEGYTVVEAENETIAMQLFEQRHPKAILLDMRISKGGSLELCKKMKDVQGDDIFIMMISSDAFDEHRNLAYLASADHFLVKPYNPETLFEILGKVFSNENTSRIIIEAPADSTAENSTANRIIPNSILDKLASNIAKGDIFQINLVVKEIELFDESLARKLKAMVESFDYPGLQAWLHKEKTKGEVC